MELNGLIQLGFHFMHILFQSLISYARQLTSPEQVTRVSSNRNVCNSFEASTLRILIVIYMSTKLDGMSMEATFY